MKWTQTYASLETCFQKYYTKCMANEKKKEFKRYPNASLWVKNNKWLQK